MCQLCCIIEGNMDLKRMSRAGLGNVRPAGHIRPANHLSVAREHVLRLIKHESAS